MAPPSTRRAALRSAAVVLSLGLAGCATNRSGGGDGSASDVSPTTRTATTDSGGAATSTTSERPTGTAGSTPTDLSMGETFDPPKGRSMTVERPSVHRSVVAVERVSGTHRYERVSTAENGQYLTATVSVSGADVEPLELPLTVEIDGRAVRERDVLRVGRDYRMAEDELAFLVPVVDAESVAIVWNRDGGPSPRWRLGPAETTALGAAPAFEFRSWSVPERVAPGDLFEAAATVANVGDRDGRYLASFDVRRGSMGLDETSVRVAVGETATVTTAVSVDPDGGGTSLRLVLDGSGTYRRTRIPVGEPGTTTPMSDG